ncbi:MAG: uroporphyrinogen decarboxylase family protein [Vicinamibacterales bacterium]
MTPRERLLTALARGVPDRLPVTTHHLMPSFLAGLGGIDARAFFDRYGLDAINWTTPLRPAAGCLPDPGSDPAIEAWSHVSDAWRVERTHRSDAAFRTIRYAVTTPRKTLSMVLQDDGRTVWVAERLLKEKSDIDILAAFAPVPCCEAVAVEAARAAIGDRGIVRGAVPGFPIYGQPGCWQDAAVLVGIAELILETYEDPAWVAELLGIIRDRKLAFVRSTAGAPFDLMELGGGDASSSVISPKIFDRFVAPFDEPVVAAAHEAGQRVVYHTCGGMMPLLERIAAMQPDAMETFTPKDMGGDTRLAEAKARIGPAVCMIGGFDQFHYFTGCAPADTRQAVRDAFAAAGGCGGFILAPSDHFFEAENALLRAYADEARRCCYRGQTPASDVAAGV